MLKFSEGESEAGGPRRVLTSNLKVNFKLILTFSADTWTLTEGYSKSKIHPVDVKVWSIEKKKHEGMELEINF
jgi:hypothetical protein